MSALVAGNSALDMHLTVEGSDGAFEQGFTRENVAFLTQAPQAVLGGNGAAAAYALGKLGVPVDLNTAVGSDGIGELIAAWLTHAEVHLISDRVEASAVHVLRSRAQDGARSSMFYTGSDLDWSVGTEGFQSGWFFASGYGGMRDDAFSRLGEVLKQVHGNRNCVVFDPGPWFARTLTRDALRAVAPYVSCLTGTRDELAVWSSAESVDQLIDDYLSLGVEQVVVKCGPDGASYGASDGARGHVEAQPVDRAHAVGAGDTFNGAMISGFYEGHTLRESVERAVEYATAAVRSGKGVLGAFE
jgi:2-dehydro-3-deoxygluconokinase